MSANPSKIPSLADRVAIATSRYVTIELAALITGYSMDAINRKIDSGVWIQGKEWKQAPDGRRLVDMLGYEAWVERGRPGDEATPE